MCLAHFDARRGCDKRKRYSMDQLIVQTSYQVRAGKDISPLVVSSQLEAAIVVVKKISEVICLKKHVIKFYKAKPGFQPDPVTFRGQHPVDAKMAADVS